MGPEIPIPDWLVDLWRYHKRKADQAKAAVDRLHLIMEYFCIHLEFKVGEGNCGHPTRDRRY